MDFSFTSDQAELRELAAKILGDATAHERVKAVLATDLAVDRDLWRTLADAGLVGISVPETAGGGGCGFLETCIVLEEVGRAAAPVPALAVMGLAAPALAHFGRDEHLDGVAAGERIVAGAFVEPLAAALEPATHASGDGRLTGEKVCVPGGLLADQFVVTADTGVFVVDAAAEGVAVQREDTTSGVPEARLVLDGAAGERLAGPDGVEWVVEHAQAAMCVMAAGACAAAVDLTAAYTKTREQFGRPIASFQAVSQRAADAYIDTEAVRLTAWQAAWRLDRALPSPEQVAIAKFWASEGAQRVVHAAHHLHGGIGVDKDYPLYRYFLLVKQLELSLGSATPSLLRLGSLLADRPVS
ncbi:MAG TPA: acyl-CoA dehydrogenase family protein [Acidimicrobiia bacterium]|nr:acyl-CoA dehydrogenase family protein [Acidimicrobiia bacterium]